MTKLHMPLIIFNWRNHRKLKSLKNCLKSHKIDL